MHDLHTYIKRQQHQASSSWRGNDNFLYGLSHCHAVNKPSAQISKNLEFLLQFGSGGNGYMGLHQNKHTHEIRSKHAPCSFARGGCPLIGLSSNETKLGFGCSGKWENEEENECRSLERKFKFRAPLCSILPVSELVRISPGPPFLCIAFDLSARCSIQLAQLHHRLRRERISPSGTVVSWSKLLWSKSWISGDSVSFFRVCHHVKWYTLALKFTSEVERITKRCYYFHCMFCRRFLHVISVWAEKWNFIPHFWSNNIGGLVLEAVSPA